MDTKQSSESQLVYNETAEQVELYFVTKKTPVFLRGFIGFLMGITTFLPFVIIGLVASDEEAKLHIGFFVLTGFLWLLSYFFLRVILWNSYGKEVFVFTSEKLEYWCDYRWFKDRSRSIDLDQVQYAIITDLEEEGDNESLDALDGMELVLLHLQFNSDAEPLQSQVYIKRGHLLKAIEDLKSSNLELSIIEIQE